MFEPSRLATAHLADAYAQLVPLRTRKAVHAAPEVAATTKGAAKLTRRRS